MGRGLMRPYNLPREEIEFASKSGFITKAIWLEFFNVSKKSWAYKRWNSFTRKAIFKFYGRNVDGSILILNRNSADVHKIVGRDYGKAPNPYQIYHDEIVIRTVLDLKRKGKIDKFFFDSELRRGATTLNKFNSDKIPDAIVFSNGKRIAIEIELSNKPVSRYRKALGIYALWQEIDEIYYLTNSAKIHRSISKAAIEIDYPKNIRPIHLGFVNASILKGTELDI
jgi:hypothetical protein